jgi:hypothetical protein
MKGKSSGAPVSATISVGGTASTGSATVFDEGRTVPITNGRIKDIFDINAVHIYVLP